MLSEELFTHFDLAKNSSSLYPLFLTFKFHMKYASKTGCSFNLSYILTIRSVSCRHIYCILYLIVYCRHIYGIATQHSLTF